MKSLPTQALLNCSVQVFHPVIKKILKETRKAASLQDLTQDNIQAFFWFFEVALVVCLIPHLIMGVKV